MNKKIIINFIKDHMGFTLVFFINSILIALFYRISTESTIEWIYPLLFSFFLFIIFIVIRWFQYYPFNNRIGKNADDVSYDLSPATCEQKQTSSVLGKIHKQYLEKIQEIKLENKHNKRFMSQWIHNMKTPVSVIDLVIQKTENEEMSLDSAVTDINEENKRLLDQLDHILNLLRLEEFSEDYLPEELDLYQAVRKVIFNRKNQFIYNRVYPLLEEVEEPIYVLSDLKWNQVILEQIISNAIKYSESGETEKHIYFNFEKNQDKFLLKIRDEGIGIPEYDIQRIFEPFFTGENGRKYRNATGIGLYLCSVIAEKLGHSIEIKSEVGQGTVVTITYLSKM